MHEGALVEAVLSVVLEAAGEEPVSRVRIRAGQDQHIVNDSFEFHWQMLAGDTPAAGAHLDIQGVPGSELSIEEVELKSGERLRNPAFNEVPVEPEDHVHDHGGNP